MTARQSDGYQYIQRFNDGDRHWPATTYGNANEWWGMHFQSNASVEVYICGGARPCDYMSFFCWGVRTSSIISTDISTYQVNIFDVDVVGAVVVVVYIIL